MLVDCRHNGTLHFDCELELPSSIASTRVQALGCSWNWVRTVWACFCYTSCQHSALTWLPLVPLGQSQCRTFVQSYLANQRPAPLRNLGRPPWIRSRDILLRRYADPCLFPHWFLCCCRLASSRKFASLPTDRSLIVALVCWLWPTTTSAWLIQNPRT